ncbi:putative ammonium transporter 2 [Ischnura elegans]|uniref:putative ammonium transporter 2 n=1 Tax=Ischnura elegans TaxID=197161 RepID=UPI001ED8AA79|nr:putative ammonium transporter 2 [Ischnura elegans]
MASVAGGGATMAPSPEGQGFMADADPMGGRKNDSEMAPGAHTYAPWIYDLSLDDTTFLMTSSFIIFTMQTGFGLLESGCVSLKNEVNIMVKNVADVVLGGFTYWIFGFGFSFGHGAYSNPFIAFGDFFLDAPVTYNNPEARVNGTSSGPTAAGDAADPASMTASSEGMMGPVFAAFLFQLSFATTATTIVSGAMAERCSFRAYCLFSLLNTIVYCVPAGWAWGEHGFLRAMGVVDIAGSGPVHLVGGTSAAVAAAMLGPRLGRYDLPRSLEPLSPGSPTNALMGLFMLWWGWLAFNSGSTFGTSGHKWKFSARAAVVTMLASFGGGVVGLAYSFLRRNRRFHVIDLINAVLGSLVSVTAGCYLYRPWEGLTIGAVGGTVACLMMPLWDRMRIDDPVGASSVHGCCGLWGLLAVGLFASDPQLLDTTRGESGLFHGGGWYLLGVQMLSAVCYVTWSSVLTFILLWCIDKGVGLRMRPEEELLGADFVEHNILRPGAGLDRALSALCDEFPNLCRADAASLVGHNSGHELYLERMVASRKEGVPPSRRSGDGEEESVALKIEDENGLPPA